MRNKARLRRDEGIPPYKWLIMFIAHYKMFCRERS